MIILVTKAELLQEEKYKLAGSLLEFTQIFYKLRTGRNFEIVEPVSRESHYYAIAKALTRVIDGKCKRLIINVPPRYGKTELLISFIAWGLAIYPDSNFLYVSYSHSLAQKQTDTVRSIVAMRQFRDVFGVTISESTSAKDNFETMRGGTVYGVGAQGSITGRGAGLKGVDRFGGAIIIDDILKPEEASSSTIREGINDWYYNTLQSRVNDAATPIVIIGQRLHENDLCGHLIESGEWEVICLPAIDGAGNALYPAMHPIDVLRKMEAANPYVFAAQYQQNPQPAGGGLFKPEWFYILDEEPKLLATFITADTAETSKEHNDASVFSLFGLYKIENTDDYALHWMDCVEIRVEPKDLEVEFMEFYFKACKHPVKPRLAIIEKKSTGVTLISVLDKIRGLKIHALDRNSASGSKTDRFIVMQPYVAGKLISFSKNARHKDFVIEHMRKITANNSHRFDDICDTLETAIYAALIDKYVKVMLTKEVDVKYRQVAKNIMSNFMKVQKIRKQ